MKRGRQHTEGLEDDRVLVLGVKVGRHDDEADQYTEMNTTGKALEDAVLEEANIVHSGHEPCCPDDAG